MKNDFPKRNGLSSPLSLEESKKLLKNIEVDDYLSDFSIDTPLSDPELIACVISHNYGDETDFTFHREQYDEMIYHYGLSDETLGSLDALDIRQDPDFSEFANDLLGALIDGMDGSRCFSPDEGNLLTLRQ